MASSLGFPDDSLHCEFEKGHFEASSAINENPSVRDAITVEEGRKMLQGIVAIQMIATVKDSTIDVRDNTVLAQLTSAVAYLVDHPDLGVPVRQSYAFKQALSIGTKIVGTFAGRLQQAIAMGSAQGGFHEDVFITTAQEFMTSTDQVINPELRVHWSCGHPFSFVQVVTHYARIVPRPVHGGSHDLED